MKKRSITLIIWLMSIALLGVMAMQYYFIRETYRQKLQLFDEAVNASLVTVASRIEKQEVLDFSKTQQMQNLAKYRLEQEKQQKLSEQIQIQRRIESLRRVQHEYEQAFKNDEDKLRARYPLVAFIENSFYETYVRRPRYRDFVTIRTIPGDIEGDIQNNTVEVIATKAIPMIPAKDDSVRYLAFFSLHDRINFVVRSLAPRADRKIALQIQNLEFQFRTLSAENLTQARTLFDTIAAIGGKRLDIITDVAAGEELSKRPLRQRVNINFVEQEITKELAVRDIKVPFNIEIRDDKSLIYNIQTVADGAKSSKASKYSTPLFQGDLVKTPGQLSVYFPNKSSIIRDNMQNLFLPVIALLALLIGAFGYTLSIIFKQKKISEMKTDFMNNMTHEFKTPVATIMIASESLRDPEIAQDEKRVSKLVNIIYDENVRLGNHIERVLNIARLEKENLKIDRVNVRLNAVVTDVLDSMSLQLQKANGTLRMDLNAQQDLVVGDELHLSNVFFNLVDNAIKYSRGNPEITLRTFNIKNHIVITISDKGMGMTNDQREKIFDQFYRIPTGNIHNVKGFGLGLSYVHDIVKRLNGKIHVKSEKDKGTLFELTFPLKGNKLDT